MNPLHFIKWFADTTIEDIPLVGRENASRGEKFHELSIIGNEQALRLKA